MTLIQATWNCAKVMLSLTLPLQVILKPTTERNTHHFCNQQSIDILKRDGFAKEALLYQSYLGALNAGSTWCDRGFKNISHYYDHAANTGLWCGPDAPSECRHYFKRAITQWQQSRQEKALFYLGAATHILQDLCVPHHAAGLILKGHKFFEDWARSNYHDFTANCDGLYELSCEPGDWVKKNAGFSFTFLPQVVEEHEPSVEKAAQVLLQRAQRSTAGFLQFFLQSVTKK